MLLNSPTKSRNASIESIKAPLTRMMEDPSVERNKVAERTLSFLKEVDDGNISSVNTIELMRSFLHDKIKSSQHELERINFIEVLDIVNLEGDKES